MATATAAMSPVAAAPAEAADPDRPPTATDALPEHHRRTTRRSLTRPDRTLFIGLLVLAALCPVSASAQTPCDPAKDRIYRLTVSEARHIPDSLRTLLDLTAFVRDCEPEVSPELDLWLLNNEVLAFDGLARYDDARARVNRFFAEYFDEAPDAYRARFLLWCMHLSARAGAHHAAITDYAEAWQYAPTLDSTARADLFLDGAYAYIGIHSHETVLRLVDEARRLIPTPQTYDARLAVARALLLAGEARLRMRDSLDQVEPQFQEAARRYLALGDTSRAAVATTLLGMTLAVQGDTAQALATMDSAATLALGSGDARSRSYTRYRQGQLLRAARAFDEAEEVLLQALVGADTVGEFALSAAYELAMLYEQRRQLKQAARFYQRVVEVARPDSLAASLASVRQAHKAEIRLLLIRSEQRQSRLRWALVAVLLLGLAGAGFVYLWRRQGRRAVPVHEPAAPARSILEPQPTGLSLEELRQRFQTAVEPPLLGARLAHLYAVLFNPDLVLAYIDDPYLKPQVEAGRIETNTALFRCAAAVETAVDGQAFSEHPANTLGAYLRAKCRQRDWPWPKNPPEWKQHFLDHHADVLS